MDDNAAGDVGVATALGRICALEAKLRQAIQHTHLLSSSFESDPAAADREREALLAIREQLELLEDKLRDFRCLGDNQYDDKTVALSQLDSLRRELIACARDRLEFLVFTKDVVREVLTFAEVNSGSSTPDHSTARQDHRPPLSPIQRSLDGTYSPLASPTASPSPKLRKLQQNALRGSYNEAVHLSSSHAVPARDRRVSQSLDFSKVERSEGVPGLSQPARQSLIGRRLAADAAQRTLDAADRIIFSGQQHGRSSKKSNSPMLSPGQVRDEALYSSTNGSSRYTFDPNYGGKVSMPKGHQPPHIRPDAAMSHPDASRPRALFADDRPRSIHGGSVRGEDDTCSLPTTTWSGQQARTPIAVRRLGPITPAQPPHQPQGKPHARVWLIRLAKLAALGAVVAVTAAGVVKAVDWHNAPAQKQKRAVRKAQRQQRHEEAQQAAWLKAQERQAEKAAAAERQAKLQQEREAKWIQQQQQQQQMQALQQAEQEEQAAEQLRQQQLLLRKQAEAAEERKRQQQAREKAEAAACQKRQLHVQKQAELDARRQQELQLLREAEHARQLEHQAELDRLAAAKEAEEQRQQQLLAEAQAAQELKRQAELERQEREHAQRLRQQQIEAEAQAKQEHQRQRQLAAQAEAECQQQQQLQKELERQRQQQLQEEAEAAAAKEAAARQAEEAQQQAWASAQSQAQETVELQEANKRSCQHDGAVTGNEALNERKWKSSEHWLPPPKGSPQVTVVGEQPRGWPAGAAFPNLPPPNIFRGQG